MQDLSVSQYSLDATSASGHDIAPPKCLAQNGTTPGGTPAPLPDREPAAPSAPQPQSPAAASTSAKKSIMPPPTEPQQKKPAHRTRPPSPPDAAPRSRPVSREQPVPRAQTVRLSDKPAPRSRPVRREQPVTQTQRVRQSDNVRRSPGRAQQSPPSMRYTSRSRDASTVSSSRSRTRSRSPRHRPCASSRPGPNALPNLRTEFGLLRHARPENLTLLLKRLLRQLAAAQLRTLVNLTVDEWGRRDAADE